MFIRISNEDLHKMLSLRPFQEYDLYDFVNKYQHLIRIVAYRHKDDYVYINFVDNEDEKHSRVPL